MNKGTCNKILKIFQKNHDELKMIFAVQKNQDLRKSWYEPKIKLNLINSIILVHFLTRRAGRKIRKNTQVTRFFSNMG